MKQKKSNSISVEGRELSIPQYSRELKKTLYTNKENTKIVYAKMKCLKKRYDITIFSKNFYKINWNSLRNLQKRNRKNFKLNIRHSLNGNKMMIKNIRVWLQIKNHKLKDHILQNKVIKVNQFWRKEVNHNKNKKMLHNKFLNMKHNLINYS